MKKIAVMCLVFSMSVPAFARPNNHNLNSPHRSPSVVIVHKPAPKHYPRPNPYPNHRPSNEQNWVGPAIVGAVILGVVLANQ